MCVCVVQDACYNAFIQRVRDNLHIVLAMSPVGEAFRARCRQFPSLINCCTIDWFSQVRHDALPVQHALPSVLSERSSEVCVCVCVCVCVTVA